MSQTKTLTLDRYFGTGGCPIPHVSLTVEEAMNWIEARRQWELVRTSFTSQAINLRKMERGILRLREDLSQAYAENFEERHQRRYCCRRRLHPLLNHILKPIGNN